MHANLHVGAQHEPFPYCRGFPRRLPVGRVFAPKAHTQMAVVLITFLLKTALHTNYLYVQGSLINIQIYMYFIFSFLIAMHARHSSMYISTVGVITHYSCDKFSFLVF